MKKLLFAALLSIVSVGAFAQYEPGSWTIAPKAGVSLSKFSDMSTSRFRPGVVAGVEFQGYASKVFSVSFGAFYSQEGTKDRGMHRHFSSTIQADYVNIPLLANFYLGKGFSLKAGIQAGINVRCKVKGPEFAEQRYVDIRDFAKPAVFSLPVGISYETNNIVLDARYNYGFNKILRGEPYQGHVLQFTIGYKFQVK